MPTTVINPLDDVEMEIEYQAEKVEASEEVATTIDPNPKVLNTLV